MPEIITTGQEYRALASTGEFNGWLFDRGKGVRVRHAIGVSPDLDHEEILLLIAQQGIEGLSVGEDSVVRFPEGLDREQDLDGFQVAVSGGEIKIGGRSGSLRTGPTGTRRESTHREMQRLVDTPDEDGTPHAGEVTIVLLPY